MIIDIKKLILLSFLLISVLASSQSLNKAYLMYIDQYATLAQRQQQLHKIPSSIILAQGLLESGAGQSALSKSSNNHFGIKCSDWQGEKTYHDDDEQGECFRKYSKVLDSYEDHSAFLINRSRYSFLFSLKPTDYEGWAFGLKQAGYATDPTYAYKLISIIENYDLHKFDLSATNANYDASDDLAAEPTVSNRKKSANESMGSIVAFVSHELKEVNGVKFVTALKGDSYASIADEFNISEARIRRYNDANSFEQLKANKRVFISAKKNKAPTGNPTHRVRIGESMRSISQDYGIKVERLYELNNIPFEKGAPFGRMLNLR